MCSASCRASSLSGSKPCSAAISMIARSNSVIVTGSSTVAPAKPASPPAAPEAVESARLNQSPRSLSSPREREAAEKARFSAASVMRSMRERTGFGSRSIRPSALPPTAFSNSIATPPAFR